MFAVSCISTMNVDWPRAMLSEAPTRAKRRSTIGSFALARRHERAGLRHQAEQRRLPQVRGLAAHVRAGQDDQLLAGRVERDVVRHERVARRAARRRDGARRWRSISSPSCIVRLGVVATTPRSRPARPARRARASARAVSWIARRLRRDRAAQRLEQLELALEDPLVGAEHLLLVFLERRRDEALAAGDGLLAVVVGRHAVRGSTSRSRCSSRRRGCSGS